MREAGLEDRVSVELRDYRDISGEYDAVVSIEMLEAVGAEYYRDYFAALSRALKPGGKAAIQVITFPHDAYEAQLRGANWIQRYIFPGGVLPSVSVIADTVARATDLQLAHLEDLAAHYAETLRIWRQRLLAAHRHLPGDLEPVRAALLDVEQPGADLVSVERRRRRGRRARGCA